MVEGEKSQHMTSANVEGISVTINEHSIESVSAQKHLGITIDKNLTWEQQTDLVCRNVSRKLLQQGYRYHKLRKTFSKFFRRHYELVSKFNVGLKTLLHQGLSEPEFYGDLVYKFKKNCR